MAVVLAVAVPLGGPALAGPLLVVAPAAADLVRLAAPVMIATASPMVCVLGLTTATRLPSRWMWIRSAMSKTWGMLCEMSTTGSPRLLIRRMRSRTIPDSRTPSAAVGSSMMTSLVPKAAARATATLCRCPPERLSTGWRTSGIRTPRESSWFWASVRIALRVDHAQQAARAGPDRRISRPRNRLEAMSSAGATARSW